MPTSTFKKSNASRLCPAGNPFHVPEIDLGYELVRIGTRFSCTTKTVGITLSTPTLTSLIMIPYHINTAMREAFNAVAQNPTR